MSTEILEIQANIKNAQDELVKTADYVTVGAFTRAISNALIDLRSAKENLDALEYQMREDLNGL